MYDAAASGQNQIPLLAFLQQIANAIAGHDVSPIRVLISSLILLMGFVSAAVILYSSIRSSIRSIGRNPLATGSIQKSLFRVLLVAFGIWAAMTVGVYLVLKT